VKVHCIIAAPLCTVAIGPFIATKERVRNENPSTATVNLGLYTPTFSMLNWSFLSLAKVPSGDKIGMAENETATTALGKAYTSDRNVTGSAAARYEIVASNQLLSIFILHALAERCPCVTSPDVDLVQ
jgi:hypothetical protein